MSRAISSILCGALALWSAGCAPADHGQPTTDLPSTTPEKSFMEGEVASGDPGDVTEKVTAQSAPAEAKTVDQQLVPSQTDSTDSTVIQMDQAQEEVQVPSVPVSEDNASVSPQYLDAEANPANPMYSNCDGTPLRRCTIDESKVSGFQRTGYCSTSPDDYGTHVVCAEVTREFLDYTSSMGNDLETPNPYYRFPGLVPGDRWCLCASRWRQALNAGKAPNVIATATQDVALNYVSMDDIDEHRVD